MEDGGLVELFFGKNGKKLLTLKKFEEFLVQLHREVRVRTRACAVPGPYP